MLTGPMRHIPSCDYRRQPWRNGAGWTREILVLPDGPDWSLRLSIAEFGEPSAYSSFAGVEREQLLLSGGGLRLDFGDGRRQDLLPPHGRVRFTGEQAPAAAPLEGPVQVFNLMWRPQAVEARLLHRPLVGGMYCFVGAATAWAVHVIGGSAHVSGQEGRCMLEAGDTAWLPGGAGQRRYAIDGAGEIVLVRVDRVGAGMAPALDGPVGVDGAAQ